MPYTTSQCGLFAEMEKRGERVPADWKQHCTKEQQAIANRRAENRSNKKRKKHGRKE